MSNDTDWTEGKIQFHHEWTRSVDARYYMRSDKRLWQELERRYLQCEKGGDRVGVELCLSWAKCFADELTLGTASWPAGGKPNFLRDW